MKIPRKHDDHKKMDWKNFQVKNPKKKLLSQKKNFQVKKKLSGQKKKLNCSGGFQMNFFFQTSLFCLGFKFFFVFFWIFFFNTIWKKSVNFLQKKKNFFQKKKTKKKTCTTSSSLSKCSSITKWNIKKKKKINQISQKRIVFFIKLQKKKAQFFYLQEI